MRNEISKHFYLLFRLYIHMTNIYSNNAHMQLYVQLCTLGCQIQVTSTLTIFDIQDTKLYTLEFKLKCKI